MLYHFSEDPAIERFVPHVPPTNPTEAPAVWAIDAEHAPLYWFPRDCPRVTAWPRDDRERMAFRSAFITTAVSRIASSQADSMAWTRSAIVVNADRNATRSRSFRGHAVTRGQSRGNQ